MKTICATFFIALVLSLASCGGSSGGNADEFGGTPNPVNVIVKTDDSRAVSKDITAEGGTVTASAADGTKFTLTLAKDSLFSEQSITLIPVSSIDGLPLSGGLTAAVQLQPEGLMLMSPATLTIEPDKPMPADELTAFGYRGKGDDLYLTPHELDSTRITMDVTHFSGNGIGLGTDADRSTQQGHPPVSPGDKLRQLDAASKDKEKRNANNQDYYERVLKPKLESAQNDTAGLVEAALFFENWRKNNDNNRNDIINKEIIEGLEMLKKGLKNATDRESSKCPSPSAFIQLERLYKVGVMIGDRDGSWKIVNILMNQCGSMKVKFSSRAQSGGGGVSWIYQVSGELELKASVEGESVKLTGSGPLVYDDFHMEGDTGCSPVTKAHGSTMSASADLNANLREGQQSPPSVALRIDPGGPSEDYALDCPYVGRTNDHAGTHAWQEIFMASNPGSLKLDGLDLESGAPVEKAFKGKTVPFGDNQGSADANVTVAFT